MSITVRELVAMPSLRTRFLAGESGGGREVLWAHPTELPDPWNWLGSGDLFLTNGLSLPEEATAQAEFIEALDRAGLSGITLNDGPHGLTLSDEALATADHLSFPVLSTEYSMPWVSLIRVVVEHNAQRGHKRIAKILRSYDVFRRAHGSGTPPRQLLAELGEEAECSLHVLAVPSGRSLLPSETPLSAALRESVIERVTAIGARSLPAFSRIGESRVSFMLPVAENTAVLIATPHSAHTDVDLMVLQHAATITGLEVERRSFAQIRKREQGSQLLQQLLAGTIDTEAAAELLSRFQLAERPWRVLSWVVASAETAGHDDPTSLLEANSVPHLIWEDGEHAVALVSDGLFERLTWLLSDQAEVVGLSRPLYRLNRITDAVQEANWARTVGAHGISAEASAQLASDSGSAAREPGNARARASSAPRGYRVYGEGVSPFQPRTISEGEAAIDAVLGPVFEHDRAHDSSLMRSLIAYFEANRTWQAAADQLGVHRQTLIYRIGQVEKLTGRRIQDIADQTELYLAVQTWKALQAGA